MGYHSQDRHVFVHAVLMSRGCQGPVCSQRAAMHMPRYARVLELPPACLCTVVATDSSFAAHPSTV
jgi:hypothetical protein